MTVTHFIGLFILTFCIVFLFQSYISFGGPCTLKNWKCIIDDDDDFLPSQLRMDHYCESK